MRIVHAVTLISDTGAFGGPTSVALAQLHECAARGHQVHLVSLWRGITPAPSHIKNVRLRTRPARCIVPGKGSLGLMHPLLLWDLWKTVGQSDVVHIHCGRDLVSLASLIVSRLRRKPFFIQSHGMVEPRAHAVARVFDKVFVPLLRRARCVFVLTSRERNSIIEILGKRRPPIVTIPNGVKKIDNSSYLSDSGHQVLFLARLHERKKPTTFVDMAGLVSKSLPGTRFVMYGPDEGELSKVLSLIEERGLTEVVRYGGALAPDEADQAYRSAAVYVLPSVNEPFPMTILESLAAGVPVVCTDSCGIADILRQRKAALITDGTPVALAHAVTQLLIDHDLRAKVREGGRRALAEDFSIQAVVDQLERVYVDSVHQKGVLG
ncbi:glycosyltransferase [Streptomyces sp. 1222.5]|uniref:glycosyltransferase n=1 Tax=Streptomyces sp. 1222.5 TaxID=1881026 RepID=UPI003D718EB1